MISAEDSCPTAPMPTIAMSQRRAASSALAMLL
jgi:hypothetical protein